MHVLVDAAAEHPYSVVMTVPIEAGPNLLATISSTLDRSGLVRGEHWSLAAGVVGEAVRLRFACSSQALADLLEILLQEHMPHARTANAQSETHGRFQTRGWTSGRFLTVMHSQARGGRRPGSREAVVDGQSDFALASSPIANIPAVYAVQCAFAIGHTADL